ncbi:MAG: hypothetical protein P8X91_07285, partial [Candidatus Bathyarchaeota archaeon]
KFFLIYQRETLNKQNSFCEDMLSLEKQMKQMITQIISSGEKEGVFRKVDEEFAISLIFGSIYGAVQKGINENISDEKHEEIREIINSLFGLELIEISNSSITIQCLLKRTLEIDKTIHRIHNVISSMFERYGGLNDYKKRKSDQSRIFLETG